MILGLLMSLFSCIALINMIVVEKLFPKQVFQNCWELLKAAQKGLVIGTLCNKNLTKQPENQMRLIEIRDKMASFRVISHFFLVLLIFLIVYKFSTSKASNQDRVQESRQGSGRAELIKAAFRALNVSGSGYLSAAEMKPFAEATGISAVIKLCHYIIVCCGVYGRLFAHVCTVYFDMFLSTWALASG